MAADINAILSVIKVAQTSADELKLALADGKLGLTDIPLIFPVLKDLREAVLVAKELPAEFSTIDMESASQIFDAILGVVNTVVSIITGSK